MKTEQSNPPPQESESVNGKSRRFGFDQPWLIVAGTVGLAGILYLGLDYVVQAFSHETTDDAFIEAHIVSVSPKISGQVAAVHVVDNQLVKQGDLLTEIDPRDYEIRLSQKNASADTTKANFKTVLSVLELMNAKVKTAQASASQAHAQADASAATARRAELDFKRAQELIKTSAISQQEFDAAQAAGKEAGANLKAAEQNAVMEDSKVVESTAQWNAAQSSVDLAQAQIKQSETEIQAADLDLSYTKISAPCDGRVTRKAVETGNYVQVGQPLLAIVAPGVWVVGNFKETQLTHMRSGQPVDVDIEALDKPHFHAHVESIQSGSGARFSLMPPENAVGNFVKVVQRVPVKIVFDEPPAANAVIGPGMSVAPSVRVGNDLLPRWAVALVAALLAVIAAFVFKRAVAKFNHRSQPSVP
jgi:membrane fusion protein (multidrug efflux system)